MNVLDVDTEIPAEGEQSEAQQAAVEIGRQLRTIRRNRQLSLQDVEAMTQQEFKASVLGAYERAERHLSVPRLKRLAHFYNVSVAEIVEDPDPEEFSVTLTFSARPDALQAMPARVTTALADAGAKDISVELRTS